MMTCPPRLGLPQLGFGVGLRSVHYQHILSEHPRVDWFEVLSDNYLHTRGRPLAFLDQIAERYPVALHGVGLSIGSGGTPLSVLQSTITGASASGVFTSRSDVQIRTSNIFGNGLAGGAAANCGIENDSGGTVDASDNYWGAASGPGVEPADSTCGPDPTTTSPHRTAELRVLLTPTR